MNEYVLVCYCFGMEEKAFRAFSLLFPGKSMPILIRGKNNIRELGDKLKNDHIKAISKLSGKFAYYIELDGDKIVKEYELLKGRRIA